MTSQIVCMNKLGLAAASDSSITITRGDNRRTYASAEKILSLGPVHKVIVLHSGNTEFLRHPIEVLISEWKRSLTKPLQRLDEYVDNLINWVSHRQDLFSEELQNNFVGELAREYLLDVRGAIRSTLREQEIGEESWGEEQAISIANEILEKDIAWLDARPDLVGVNANWSDSRYDLFRGVFSEEIEFVFDDVPRDETSDALYEKICRRLMYKHFISNQFDSSLVVAGYGEQDTYPVQAVIDLQGVLADRPRYTRYSKAISPDPENDTMVETHGQAEAIHTFLRAYHSSFRSLAVEKLDEFAATIIDEVSEKSSSSDKDALVQRIEELREQKGEDIREAFLTKSQDDWVSPFTSTLSGLPMTSLAKMAESLIELQILRQSSQAVQDTVGGPVDIAVVTRDRGVEWIRHKSIDDLWRSI